MSICPLVFVFWSPLLSWILEEGRIQLRSTACAEFKFFFSTKNHLVPPPLPSYPSGLERECVGLARRCTSGYARVYRPPCSRYCTDGRERNQEPTPPSSPADMSRVVYILPQPYHKRGVCVCACATYAQEAFSLLNLLVV
ncbi:uncharacterized protein LY79DRAFT_227887 [Colletotrichum navitas]|uniref:Secreted protein n=1 Tax=Colletotrichum navitas TaxID=681940 RepID=A0AAD8PZK8_9PEZI|nr:uncharacterized protein LY79DRAFT_227887 [Colletotrichum navitas]KAK1590037.1 hypothetical protein LY79DRAFT_227887 [Colletotrichum navitas]